MTSLTPGRAARAAAVLFLLALPAHAISDPSEMLPDARQEARAEAVGRQLRCLVCQNESIEDSNADLARDLRRLVRQRIAAGESDDQAIGFLTARYGDFVRLKPPFNAVTAALWASPALAVALGATAVFVAHRRRPAAPAPLTDAERRRLADLTRS